MYPFLSVRRTIIIKEKKYEQNELPVIMMIVILWFDIISSVHTTAGRLCPIVDSLTNHQSAGVVELAPDCATDVER